MLKRVTEFLAMHWDGRRPLLLGYSGGPDSKALLYTLLEAGCSALHLAHVDHGWRDESGEESLELEREAKSLGLPFHAVRLNLPSHGNREATSREARHSFFRSLFERHPFQALLLAHQADDAAETTLKRVLEGAHLPFLGGMEPVGQIQGMNLWRPFITVKKEEILAFLSSKGLTPFFDPTNFDSVYLRARMRKEILPSLAKAFGKEISNNLLFLGSRAAELKAYLEKKTEVHTPRRGPWGLFGYIANLERLEARFLLQKWGEIEKIRLPRTLLEATLDAAASTLPNQRIHPRIFADRGHVFFLSEAPPSWGTDPLRLVLGSWEWGDWTVVIEEVEGDGGGIAKEAQESGWKKVWSGHFTVEAPKGGHLMLKTDGRLRRLWNEGKVPAFFRSRVPVVSNEIGEAREFLLGKKLPVTGSYFKLVFSTRSAPIR